MCDLATEPGPFRHVGLAGASSPGGLLFGEDAWGRIDVKLFGPDAGFRMCMQGMLYSLLDGPIPRRSSRQTCFGFSFALAVLQTPTPQADRSLSRKLCCQDFATPLCLPPQIDQTSAKASEDGSCPSLGGSF